MASRSPEQLTQLFEQISGSDVLEKPYEVRAPCSANMPLLSLLAGCRSVVSSVVRNVSSVLHGAVLLWLLPPLLLVTLHALLSLKHPAQPQHPCPHRHHHRRLLLPRPRLRRLLPCCLPRRSQPCRNAKPRRNRRTRRSVTSQHRRHWCVTAHTHVHCCCCCKHTHPVATVPFSCKHTAMQPTKPALLLSCCLLSRPFVGPAAHLLLPLAAVPPAAG